LTGITFRRKSYFIGSGAENVLAFRCIIKSGPFDACSNDRRRAA
jgi:hypothetical protein